MHGPEFFEDGIQKQRSLLDKEICVCNQGFKSILSVRVCVRARKKGSFSEALNSCLEFVAVLHVSVPQGDSKEGVSHHVWLMILIQNS